MVIINSSIAQTIIPVKHNHNCIQHHPIPRVTMDITRYSLTQLFIRKDRQKASLVAILSEFLGWQSLHLLLLQLLNGMWYDVLQSLCTIIPNSYATTTLQLQLHTCALSSHPRSPHPNKCSWYHRPKKSVCPFDQQRTALLEVLRNDLQTRFSLRW